MCGIVGFLVRDRNLYPHLGKLVTPMLVAMGSRGPDSAGIALFTDDVPARSIRWSLRARAGQYEWEALANHLESEFGTTVTLHPVADMCTVDLDAEPELVNKILAGRYPDIRIMSFGNAIEVYKDVGHPRLITERYEIEARAGYLALGHTRLATESAVTTDHSHPFSGGTDLCLVHNGSFSNYATVRRTLMRDGITFETDNDSEVAAKFLAHEIGQGSDLSGALRSLMSKIDGFYTLLVATEEELAVVRDPFACKPAVIAQTESYVAIASEYHALTGLPLIDTAEVFEPKPKEIYLWSR